MKNLLNTKKLLIIIIIIEALLLSWDISAPFVGLKDSTHAKMGNEARNLLKHGFLELKFGLLTSGGPTPKDSWQFYLHHPSLTRSILAVGYMIFGISEWSTRLVSILFGLGNLIILFFIIDRTLTRRLAYLSVVIMGLLPMQAYFGRIACSIVFFFILVPVYFYILWIENYMKRYFFGLLLFTIIGCMISWHFYFLSPCLFLYHLVQRRKNLVLVALLSVINLLCFGLIFYQIYLLGGENALVDIFEAFLVRSGIKETYHHTAVQTFTILQFLRRISGYMLMYYTVPICLISLIWLISFILNIKKEIHSPNFLVLLFLFSGITNSITFLSGTYHHEVYLFSYWIPFFSISGALGIVSLKKFLYPMSRRFYFFMIIFLSLLFVSQSGFIVHRRHIQKSGYPVEYNFSKAVAKNTNYEDGILTSIICNTRYVPFYADRRIAINIKTIDELSEKLINEPGAWRYFVTTTMPILGGEIPFFRGEENASLDWRIAIKKYLPNLYGKKSYLPKKAESKEAFVRYYQRNHGVLTGDDLLMRFLETTYKGKISDGFIFFDLKHFKK